MKKLLVKRNQNLDRGTKYLHISSHSDQQDNLTIVRKGFLYKVTIANELEPKVEAPQVYIRKAFDTKNQIEKFSFQVKGTFYLTHNRHLMKVDFHHSLNVKIIWKKKKNFSPKKSEVLT